MRRDLDTLAKRTYDVAIIGGGINGAACAREAALRGLATAIVEAGDFASGTSSRSSKLIHGGLRYLEQLQFRLVRESRLERRILSRLASHLARPLPFVLPIYRGDPYSPLKVRAGLAFYDLLGNLGPADCHRILSREETLRLAPAVRPEGLRAGAIYHDSETDDARLTLEMILAAAERGAAVANYAEVRAFGTTSSPAAEVASAEVEDRLTGRSYELRARFWVNAAGPWVDRVRALLPGFDGAATVRLTKGIHLILPAVAPEYALFAAAPLGDRVFLLLPWHGYALLGTTDTDFRGDAAHVAADRGDITYLLSAANRVLRRPFEESQVVGTFAGLRALALEPTGAGRTPSENTREYRFHSEPGIGNFISICGGKLTTARALAEKLVELVAARLGKLIAPARLSRTTPLPGGNTGPWPEFLRRAGEEASKRFALAEGVGERIVRTYGSRWRQVLEPVAANPALSDSLPGSPPILAAEVQFAAREEMAVNAEDFLLRRSGLGWLAAATLNGAAPAVAALMLG